MSTYYDTTKGRYLNFERAVVESLKSVAAGIETAVGEQVEIKSGVRFDTAEQALTDEQRANARANIDVVSATVAETLTYLGVS